jgi:HAD superfamily hydrolase (TIGR01549 family)
VQKYLEKLVGQAEVIFWDFDGVIKDSVEVKSMAFEKLFSDYDQNLVNRVREHHEKNGGVSRFEKIPLYLSWSEEVVSSREVQEFCNRFSLLTKQAVINSPLVDGFLEFIENYKERKNILVTATPTEEIKEILHALNIQHFFHKIYGAPDTKSDVINETLREMKISPQCALMLGDSASDYKAAKDNDVLFLLRGTELNKSLQSECKDFVFKDFINE